MEGLTFTHAKAGRPLYIKDEDFCAGVPAGEWVEVRVVRDVSRGEARLYINDVEVYLRKGDLAGILLGGFEIASAWLMYLDDVSCWIDSDLDDDGTADAEDDDSDNDGFLNDDDAFILDGSEHLDTDGGGLTDGKEDLNHNGKAEIGETSPINPADDDYPSALSRQAGGCSRIIL